MVADYDVTTVMVTVTGFQKSVIGLIYYPYNNLTSFIVTCGKSGVLSPFLFNIYVDQLTDDICSKNVGCYVN